MTMPARRLSRATCSLRAHSARARACRAPCSPLSSISSQPPPPCSSWTDYALRRARDHGSFAARPPRLRDLDPSGYLGGYYESIREERVRASAEGPGIRLPALPNAGDFEHSPARSQAQAQAQTQVQEQEQAQAQAEDEALAFVRGFSMKPRDIVAKLDEYVIGQDAAKRVLAVAVCDHFNHARRSAEDPSGEVASAERSKPNVLIVGPTGSGKTFLVRTLARVVRAPFVKADATKFSATGFVGRDTEEIVRDLMEAANGSTRAAEHGIVYVDEADKLCAAGDGVGLLGRSGGGSVNTRDVQTSLLKLMEDADVSIGTSARGAGGSDGTGAGSGRGAQAHQRRVSTKHVLWIFSGAFNAMHRGLAAAEAAEDARAAEEDEAAVAAAAGGSAEESRRTQEEVAHRARLRSRARNTVEAEWLVGAGLEPEFIGRLPVRVRCGPLREEDYVAILLHSKASALSQAAEDFRGYGIDFSVSASAVREIARLAMAQGTGARALVTTVEAVFRDLKYELPSAGVTHFIVDEHMVRDPDSALHALLSGVGCRQGAGAGGNSGDDGSGGD